MNETEQSLETPVATIWFGDKEALRSRPKKGEDYAEFGKDLKFDASVLEEYCFQELTPAHYGLLVIAACVAYADRMVRRRLSIGWNRELKLYVFLPHECVPVLEPHCIKICDVLNFLTGDRWILSLVRCNASALPKPIPRLHLRSPEKPIVLPFSNGLDSFSVSRLLARASKQRQILITAGTSRQMSDEQWSHDPVGGARRYQVKVPFSLSPHGRNRLAEQSYRSRSFVFAVLAAIACGLSDANEVYIPESGQGIFGPWLTPVGIEALDIRMNPVLFARLEPLLSEVFQHQIRFRFPRMWSTKGETLAELHGSQSKSGRRLSEGWTKTRSCARRASDIRIDGRAVDCGVCAACLFRRMSIYRAGISTPSGMYAFSNLASPRLEGALEEGDRIGRNVSENDRKHAVAGVLSMMELASFGSESADAKVLKLRAMELAPILEVQPSQVEVSIRDLVERHRAEWHTFVEKFGRQSFLANWALQD